MSKFPILVAKRIPSCKESRSEYGLLKDTVQRKIRSSLDIVQILGIRIQNLGLRVRFSIWGLQFRVQNIRFRFKDFRVLEFRV